jgi:hypothetical protein
MYIYVHKALSTLDLESLDIHLAENERHWQPTLGQRICWSRMGGKIIVVCGEVVGV